MTAKHTHHIVAESVPAIRDSESVTPDESLGEMMLNEACTAVRQYLSVTEAQAVAITLYAAATHAVKTFPAFGRLFFCADGPESGKTAGMTVAALLSSNPQEIEGSVPSVNAMLAEASNQTEKPVPTGYYDEIQEIFGPAGLNTGGKHPIVKVLRKGYKRGATSAWSVQRVRQEFSIYMPVIVAGLGTALPVDVRSRSIVIKMVKGRPMMDLDGDGAEARLEMTGKALGAVVRKAVPDMKGYTCEGMLPKLTARNHQIWRPLFAVAKYVGGPKWFVTAVRAFTELTGDGAAEILSADQRTLKDLVEATQALDMKPSDFIGGLALAEELSNLDRFDGRAEISIAKEIARVMPVDSTQKRVKAPGETGNGTPVRGYNVRDILMAWEAAKPSAVVETEVVEAEVNPFTV